MKVVIDIECNGLSNPSKIWCIVCKDVDTGLVSIFRNLTTDLDDREKFYAYAKNVTQWIGHNLLGYDYLVIRDLLGDILDPSYPNCVDTLIVSKLVEYSREGHSVEDYGQEFGLKKGANHYLDFFKQWSQELEDYCVRDVEITERIFRKYSSVLRSPSWTDSLRLEHRFQLVCNDLHTNGFGFNVSKAMGLKERVEKELAELDKEILNAFPPRQVLVKEFTPRATKFGTISKTSVPRSLWSNISDFEIGQTYPVYRSEVFNPSSHKQLIEVLHEAGWSPTDKTQSHIDTEREINRLKYTRTDTKAVDLPALCDKLLVLGKYGWKINEQNLSSLPTTAPAPARSLAKRILLESRRRTLTEWLGLVCTEIKIEVESIKILGHAIEERMTQFGVPRNKNITEKDTVKEISNVLENLTCTNSNNILKKNVKEDTTLNLNTDLLSKSLIECLKSKKVSVKSVIEKENFLWITIIPQEKSGDYFANLAIQFLAGLKTNGLKYSVTSERIKGRFQGIGAWTHRMAHQQPNTANITSEFKLDGSPRLLGRELRELWIAPKKKLLVGVDAEGIQLRIFAHYINDAEFTDALVKGKKDDKTDPHSLNQKILGSVCKSRAAAKRFIYALLLGAGIGKLSQVLETSEARTKEALDRLLQRYTGFAKLKQEVIPNDARNGWFEGLDGRRISIPGGTASERRHLCMSGYLQSGEAIVIKRAAVYIDEALAAEKKLKEWMFVNLIHDELQSEVKNDMKIALRVAKIKADAIRIAGEELKLRCPLAGSYWNDDHKDYTVGTTWYSTH